MINGYCFYELNLAMVHIDPGARHNRLSTTGVAAKRSQKPGAEFIPASSQAEVVPASIVADSESDLIVGLDGDGDKL